MARGKAGLAAAAFGAFAVSWLAFGGDAQAKPTPPNVDCADDSECLGKRYAIPASSKVSTVIEAARLSSSTRDGNTSGAETGTAWVARQAAAGYIVLSTDEHLLEGTILIAVTPADATELTKDGSFRYVGG